MVLDTFTAFPPQQETFFRDVLNGLHDAVAVFATDGRLLYANQRLVGHVNCSHYRCMPEAVAADTCGDCLLCAAREAQPSSTALVSHADRVYKMTVSQLPVGDEPALLVVWQDVTEQEEATRLLRGQYSKMRRDILHARSVQSSLLPRKLLQIEGYFFDCLYKPCEEMSGDIFDIVRIGRDNIAFYVADVAGHGVTAAMLTVFFSTAIRLEMRHMDMPGDVLSRIHRRFIELYLEEQCYITAFLAKLELSTGRLYWSNAGHICPPIIVEPSGAYRELEMAGLPISRWFENQTYRTDATELVEGESLLLYSDGLEARWHDLPLYGDIVPALGALMHANRPERTLEAIWQKISAQQKDYEAKDDTTLLLLSRHGDGRGVC